ncbi:GNAT family N-acetyltransferase [Tetragenococcus solitarius]|uniref:N-acetyltransferase n=1 Tax=Tetragenococcus solitarius TaxID=71453 RepID=A0ABN3YE55_9ENTE|nr:N-acetyltransferase [Tetragenococcus solitarius]
MVTLKTIEPSDYQAVDSLIRRAFTNTEEGYGNEAELVANLRKDPTYQSYFEIVALKNDTVVGHGLLSEVSVCKDDETMSTGLCLAPLAVLPQEQNQGIGAKILTELETRAKQEDYPFISILGHPAYYSKFGYQLARHYYIQAPFPVPEEAYFIKELYPNSLKNVQGTICYLEAFNE